VVLSCFAGFGASGLAGVGSAVEFSQAPASVRSGLDALAAADHLTPPAATSTQPVYLANVAGVERFTIDIAGTGTSSQLTVGQNGHPVTAPTKSTTTWATLSGSGAQSNAAATAEVSALATALGLSAPTSTTSIKVSTTTSGVSTYTLRLASTAGFGAGTISVDSNGNPVGNINVPFSSLPAALQTTLNNNAPSGATALAGSSTIKVRTLVGVTTYSATFTTGGTQTMVSVNANNQLATLPSASKTTFQSIPAATAAEIQTLATADGFTGTISATQTVRAYNEGNGTTVYSIALPTTKTSTSGRTFSVHISLGVDQVGNPTTLPIQNLGFDSLFDDFGGGWIWARGFRGFRSRFAFFF
jgi:hypothetical protein